MDGQNFPHSIEFCPFLGPLARYRLTITVIQSMIICFGDKPTEKQKYAKWDINARLQVLVLLTPK